MTDVDRTQTRASPEASPWTEERIEKLKTLCAARKLSFSQIAAELGGGISRNAAIGKANRLGLEGRSVGREPGPKVNRQRTGMGAVVQKINAAVQKINSKAQPKIKPEPFVPACVEVEPRNLAFHDLEENDCRFAYGDNPFTFCGHPKTQGSSYCASHHRLCKAGIPQRRGGVSPLEFGKAKGGVFGRVA